MNWQKVFSKPFIIVCAVLVTSLVGMQSVIYAFGYYLSKEPIQLRSQLYTIEGEYDNFKKTSESPAYSDAILEELGTRDYISWYFKQRNVVLPNGEDANAPNNQIRLHFAYYTGTPDAVPHVPERCQVAQGHARTLSLHSSSITLKNSSLAKVPNKDYWSVFSQRSREVRLPSNTFPVRVFNYAATKDNDNSQWVIYFFIANGSFIDLPEKVRLKVFDLSSKYAYYSKVELGIPAYVKTEEEALELSAKFLSEVLPEILVCIPDWYDVKAGLYPVKKDN